MPELDIAGLKASTDIVALIGRYLDLKPAGSEFAALCPFHAEKSPSFKVSPSKQIFCCFGCGEKGDALDFLKAHLGVGLREAAEILGAETAAAPADRPKRELKRAPPRRTFAAPEGNRPDIRTRLGDPMLTWDYMSETGHLLGVVARFDTPDGKEVLCWSWGAQGDEPPGWACRHFAEPRPLYGLPRLKAKKVGARVIVVEGEKTADAAAILFPANPVLTWPGGAKAVHKADWRYLSGRDVVLIPDNDAAGVQAMERIAALLYANGANSVTGVNPDTLPDGSETPQKWDLANAVEAGWKPADATAWAKARMTVYARPDSEPAPEPDPEPPRPVLTVVQAVPEAAEPIPAPVVIPAPIPAPAPRVAPDLLVADGNTLRKPVRREIPADAALPVEFSDDALAEAFTVGPGVDWRSVPATGDWYMWTGERWQVDQRRRIVNEVRLLCRTISSDAGALSLSGRQRIASKQMARSVIEFAIADPRQATELDDWDSDDWLLGVPGGVVDLRTGEMQPGRKDVLVSKQTAVAPVPGPTPLWDSVVGRAARGDQAYRIFLQKWCGLTLSGDTSQEAFIFLHGKGGSGKSTFVEALADILGEYATTAPIEAFTSKPNQEHSTEIARLAGARMVAASETEEGSRFNEARLKALTGRDTIAARFMRADFFEFKPRFKLWITGNSRPGLRSVGEEMRRRIHLIEFADSIPQAQRDTTLKDRLKAEYPAILAWCIEGAQMYLAEGLRRPADVEADVDQYLESEDSIGAWIADCADMVTGFEEKFAAVYRSFATWAKENGEYVLPSKRFSQKLVDRGFERRRGSKNVAQVIGLRLRLPDMPDAPDY